MRNLGDEVAGLLEQGEPVFVEQIKHALALKRIASGEKGVEIGAERVEMISSSSCASLETAINFFTRFWTECSMALNVSASESSPVDFSR